MTLRDFLVIDFLTYSEVNYALSMRFKARNDAIERLIFSGKLSPIKPCSDRKLKEYKEAGRR